MPSVVAKIPALQTTLQELLDKTGQTSTSLAEKLDKKRAQQSKMVTEKAISQMLMTCLIQQQTSLEANLAQQQASLEATMAKEQESSRKAMTAENSTLFNKLQEILNARLPLPEISLD